MPAHQQQDLPRMRRFLSADALHAMIRGRLDELSDTRRQRSIGFPIGDAAMAAFAMFSLKDPSLLAFDERREDHNLHSLYRLRSIPCDTQMRTILDPVDPNCLRPCFVDCLDELQRGKVLKSFEDLDGFYLLSIDGTGYFASSNIACPSCLEKKSADGKTSYAHQMLGAVIVHPHRKEVIPLAPEPIIRQDGDNKNDCERNAAKRLLEKLRGEHPRLRFLVIEDALASNAPHIRLLQSLRLNFLLGVKPGDHRFLFDQLVQASDEGRSHALSWTSKTGVHCEASYALDLPLNESNSDLRVNVLQYFEYDADGNMDKQFSWVTDLEITRGIVLPLVQAGRARWKIENETFNTLKNQGYNLEHNYGHGAQNLSVVFAMLMMLAFLVDQIQQACCPLFQAVLKKLGSRRALWHKLRVHFESFRLGSMRQLYELILSGRGKEVVMFGFDSS